MTDSAITRRDGLRGIVGLGMAGAAVALGGAALASPAQAAYQPVMDRGVADLEAALDVLRHGRTNKGGHRVKAMALIQDAIDELKAGIAVGDL